MFPREDSPGPDRFAEGFSMLIASSVILGLIDVGKFGLPNWLAKIFSVFLVGTAIFGVWWAAQGYIDRRYTTDN